MKIAEMTQAEFTRLLDDYFAAPEQRHKMTDDEIKELAQRLNTKINVPIINETREEKILIKIVMKIDTFLYDNLPNEFYDLVRSLDDGIDDDEAKRLIKRLAKLANAKINIPYLPETAEYVAIRFIIAIIINAARKQHNIDTVMRDSEKLNISSEENPSDRALEALVV